MTKLWRKLMVAGVILSTGVLPNHLSCSRVVGDSVAEGFGDFLSATTAAVLVELLLPEGFDVGLGGNDGNGGDGDPFEPPVQG
jgi:hypothetical protein